MGRDVESHDIIRGKKEVKSEGVMSADDAATFGANVTALGDVVIFNRDTTDDVMTFDPASDAENGTIEVDIDGTVGQIPFWNK